MLSRPTPRAQESGADTSRASFLPLDLGDRTSILGFAAAFADQHRRCDALICNAGAMMPTREVCGSTGWERNLGGNHLGHFLLIQQLLPLLRAARGRPCDLFSRARKGGRDFGAAVSRVHNPGGGYKVVPLVDIKLSHPWYTRGGAHFE